MGRRAARWRRTSSRRPPRDPHELGALIVEPPAVEPSVERLHFEPGDSDEPFPFRARRPPDRDRPRLGAWLAAEGGDVDAVVALRVLDVLPDEARRLLQLELAHVGLAQVEPDAGGESPLAC